MHACSATRASDRAGEPRRVGDHVGVTAVDAFGHGPVFGEGLPAAVPGRPRPRAGPARATCAAKAWYRRAERGGRRAAVRQAVTDAWGRGDTGMAHLRTRCQTDRAPS